jgi:predicted nucleic acid-binding protein
VLLDTCFCIDVIREGKAKSAGPATGKLTNLKETQIFISLFSLCELRSGAEMSANPKKELQRIENMLEFISVLYPDNSFSVFYGEAEAYLRKQGTPIPVMDLLIGITAKAAGMTLITKDTRHFQLIPGLVVISY